VILLGGSAAELRLRTRQLQAWAATKLLLCADVEEGVGQRFEGASWLVPPLALGRLHGDDPAAAEELAERYGSCSGREARALGLNWVLGPVCDVNNNPANPVINVRAWGETPATAGALAAAFVRGAQAEGVLCCAKHFPGHGDTASDSHLELPLLPHSRERLETVELPPFRAAIAAGVASVMTAHLLLPELDQERPATLSAAVLTGLLREELGFGGLVVTDALVMEAITAHHGAGEAAVLALEAGADLVLMPADADAAMAAILAAVEQGRLGRERLEASAERRRQALASLRGGSQAAAGSVDEASPEPLGHLAAAGSSAEDALKPLGPLSNGPISADRQLALELVQRSLRHQGGRVSLPAKSPAAIPAINLIRVDTALGCPYLQPTAPGIAAQTAHYPPLVGPGGATNVAVMNLVVPRRSPMAAEATSFALFLTDATNQLAFAREARVLPSSRAALQQFKQDLAAPVPATGGAADAQEGLVRRARALAVDNLGRAKVLVPATPGVKRLQAILYTQLQRAMLGQIGSDAALAEAERQWNRYAEARWP